MRAKQCPCCGYPVPLIIRVHPLRGAFTKYFVECGNCHCCGKTKVGKKRAVKAWNRRVGT